VLTTDQKGAIAEAVIAATAIKLGIGVFRPLTVERCDLIFNLRPQLLRVQCKWAVRRGEVVVVPCFSSPRRRHGSVRHPYTADEIDAIGAYCADLDRCYFLPLEFFPGRIHIQLRLSPTRNNQKFGVNWAEEFEFAATLRRTQGAIAQLGERCHGMAEVAGSSPAGSTPLKLSEL
jgi:hypothetical protein